MKRKFLFPVLFAMLVGVMVFAQSKDETAVTTSVEILRKAMVDGDRAALEKIAAPGLSYGHSSGKVEDKTAFVEAIASGASDFVTIDLSAQTVKVSGNTAVVRHTLSATTNDGGKPGSVKLYILLVWQKQGGAWKLLARQAVKVPV
jgi:ketosteroid isomerase-like protein